MKKYSHNFYQNSILKNYLFNQLAKIEIVFGFLMLETQYIKMTGYIYVSTMHIG